MLLRRLLVVPSLVRQQKQKGREKLAATVMTSGSIWLAPISSKEVATSLISPKRKVHFVMSKEKNQKKRQMPLVVSWQPRSKKKERRRRIRVFERH
uniref:Uncharacterized protein n=1 Tax=Lactuca sativa TaxID=4236 RepID=A0A9R1XVL1_LACSA|nr:hypothetical protein LSAT_V11C100016630 [Lactuca sativa]